LALLLLVKLSAVLLGRHFGYQSIILSVAAIFITVNTALIVAVFRQNLAKKPLQDAY